MSSTPASSRSTPLGQVIKISRKSIPSNLTYDEFVVVYKQLLLWLKTITLSDPGHPAYTAEQDFLADHIKLQRSV